MACEFQRVSVGEEKLFLCPLRFCTRGLQVNLTTARLTREKSDFYSQKNVTQGGIGGLCTILIGDGEGTSGKTNDFLEQGGGRGRKGT